MGFNIRINRFAKIIGKVDHHNLVHVVGLAVSYALLHFASLKISSNHSAADLIWLPSGISVAWLLLYRFSVWPGILVGAWVAPLLSGDTVIQSTLSAIGNTVDPLLAAWLLKRRMDFDVRLTRQRDLWLLILCAGVVGPLVNTVIGTPAYLYSNVPVEDYAHFLFDWWLSEFTSVIMLTPLLLMAASRTRASCKVFQRPKEAASLATIILGINWIVWMQLGEFMSRHAGSRLLIPFFIWAAVRMGQRGTALLAVLVLGQDLWLMHLASDRAANFFLDKWDLWLFAVLMTLCSQFVALIFNERDNAAKALLESEERHRLSQVYGGIGTWEADLINNKQIWSENCIRILGFPALENPTWDVFLMAIHPEDRAAVIAATKAHIELGMPYEVEYRILVAEHEVRWMRSIGQAEFAADGVPVRMRGIVEDITEKAELSQSLRESENRYRVLLQEANDAILVADMNGNLEEINRAGENLLGYSRNEICRMHVSQIHPETELHRVRQHFSEFSELGVAEPIATKILCKDGRIVDVEIRPTLMEIAGRRLVQGIFIDRTEQIRLENERLLKENAHRNALVREVHHRIKNNLQGVTGVLRLYADTHPVIAEPINQAVSQVQSVAVIHGLQGRQNIDTVRLCELTLAIAAGIESLWGKPITVDIPYPWIPCTIAEAEAVPLALVLNELITNAVKHGNNVKVLLSHEPLPDSIRVNIYNDGHFPAKNNPYGETAFDTGLQLISSLLPRSGARLGWEQNENIVITTLELDRPVIVMEPNALKDNDI